jgi:hypothetical protein
VIDYPELLPATIKNAIYTPEMIKKVVFTVFFGTHYRQYYGYP